MVALSKFLAAWKIKLEEKRLVELEEEKKARAAAAAEIANFNSQREIKLSAKKESNRNEESLFIEATTTDLSSPHLWERVTKLVDINAGENADTSKSDTGRMRKLFIQLKVNPIGE